jgi:hypothetical protein
MELGAKKLPLISMNLLVTFLDLLSHQLWIIYTFQEMKS